MKLKEFGTSRSRILIAWLLATLSIQGVFAAEKPNIIYILADDLGYGDLGSYGQKYIATPSLDRMAADGMRFTQHYSGSTVCAPSRCSLLTGKHTGHSAIRDNQRVEGVLRKIIDNKLSSGFRRHSAKKRSVLQSVPLHSASDAATAHDPSAQVIADELYELIAAKLHELHGFDLRFRLAELGLLLHMSGVEIHRTLEHEYPDRQIPSEPNIRRKLAADREALRVYLKKVWELEDE